MNRFEMACFDMAGTTMSDTGLVLEAFGRTIEEMDVVDDAAVAARDFVIETMGQSKIEVFTHIFGESAERANAAFEGHFVDVAHELGVSEVPGAKAAIEALRERGVKVALTTGFSPATREVLIDALGWSDLFDLRVSPADAGRGRPAPDMLLWCMLQLQVTAVNSVIAVGDTASDMMAGKRAGVGLCVGVLTGTDDAERLAASGADVTLDSVVDLLNLDL